MFVGLLVAVASVIGLGYWITAPHHSFWFWWRQALLAIAGAPLASGLDLADTPFHSVLQVVLSILGLVLPGLVLGIVVFKAFVAHEIFTVRRRITLLDRDSVLSKSARAELETFKCGPRCLAIRLYSSTKLALDEVTFKLYARIGSRGPKGVRSLANYPLNLCKATWPIALTHVPYTLYIPLKDDDVVIQPESNTPQLVAMQGHGLGERCRLLLHVQGSVPELNQQFFEAHWFDADSCISSEPFGEVDVDYELPSSAWKGWDDFE